MPDQFSPFRAAGFAPDDQGRWAIQHRGGRLEATETAGGWELTLFDDAGTACWRSTAIGADAAMVADAGRVRLLLLPSGSANPD